jgi:hypothetical protein
MKKRECVSFAIALAIVGVATLSPQTIRAQGQNKEQADQAEQRQIAKYGEWLADMAADYPALQGASIYKSGREGGFSMDRAKSYTIYLVRKEIFAISTDADGHAFTLGHFVAAVKRGLDDLEGKRIRATWKVVPQEMAQQWLADIAVSEPDLSGVKLVKDNKASGIGGNGVYDLYVGSDRMCGIELPAASNTKEEFAKKLKEFLSGDIYIKEGPQGVVTEIRKGAARVMGLTGLRFEYGNVYFFNQTSGPKEFSLKGSDSENKSVVWEKVGERDLRLIVTEKNGAQYEYPIRNGVFYSNEEKKIR